MLKGQNLGMRYCVKDNCQRRGSTLEVDNFILKKRSVEPCRLDTSRKKLKMVILDGLKAWKTKGKFSQVNSYHLKKF